MSKKFLGLARPPSCQKPRTSLLLFRPVVPLDHVGQRLDLAEDGYRVKVEKGFVIEDDDAILPDSRKLPPHSAIDNRLQLFLGRLVP